MWIAFHNPFKLAFARRAKAINLKQSNPKGVLRAFSCTDGAGTNVTPAPARRECILMAARPRPAQESV